MLAAVVAVVLASTPQSTRRAIRPGRRRPGIGHAQNQNLTGETRVERSVGARREPMRMRRAGIDHSLSEKCPDTQWQGRPGSGTGDDDLKSTEGHSEVCLRRGCGPRGNSGKEVIYRAREQARCPGCTSIALATMGLANSA
jgi:hypothetical protein